METVIKEISGREQLKKFIDFPYQLYKNHRYYVPPLKQDVEQVLNRDKNPAFDHCEAKYWLAFRGKRVVGRIAGIINYTSIDKWNNKYIRFGWIDFENDEEIAKGLLEQVESWAKDKGMVAVTGPMGFTNLDHTGMLIDGFDQLGTAATIYNYPYYPLLLEKAGYGKEVDWVEYKIRVPEVEPERLEKITEIVMKRLDLRVIRPSGIQDVLHHSGEIFGLLNSVYADLYGTVPLTDKQVHFYTRKYLSYIRPDFVSLVTDKKGELVAFGITMPSLSLALQKARGHLFPLGFYHLWKAIRKNKTADLYLIAVRKDFQGKGVNGLLMHEITRTYLVNNIEYAESNPELEQNTKVQSIWEHYQAVRHKRRRCYIKYL